MAEALQQVKAEMGTEAVILHTRTYQRRAWLGLRRQEVVEITAGRGLATLARGGRRSTPATHGGDLRGGTALATRPAQPMVRRALPDAAPQAPAHQRLLETPVATTAFMAGLSQEMTCLKSMVSDLVKQARAQKSPQVPEELFDYYLQLVQNQVAEELATEVLKALQANLRPDHCRNADYVREKIADQIEKLLPVAGPILRTKKVGPHVVALIGPTGVGKTTTLAKLAANLKLRENRKVGLITIDTYRIAAVDQLRRYADIIGAPLRVVGTPDELRGAIDAMGDCEYVLIDTAGRSPTDTIKLNELKNFITMAAPDEVHLVLSTTASQACIESAIARFSEVRVDKIIFTKLDEAVHVGVLLNVVHKVGKGLSYVTTGQDVPDDIEVGQGRRIAQLILGAKAPAGVSL